MTKSSHLLGAHGEQLAEEFLLENGYVILDRNSRTSKKEIDLVVRDGNVLVFCEVKTRRSNQHGHPVEAVTPKKFAHMQTAALEWLAHHHIRHSGIRFDIIGILINGTKIVELTHIKGVCG